MSAPFKVRIDNIRHLVPAPNSGKKEWWIIGISQEYQENQNFVGWMHLPDVFLQVCPNIAVGDVLDPIVDVFTRDGKLELRVTGFNV